MIKRTEKLENMYNDAGTLLAWITTEIEDNSPEDVDELDEGEERTLSQFLDKLTEAYATFTYTTPEKVRASLVHFRNNPLG